LRTHQFPLKSTQPYLLKPLPEKDRDNVNLTQTVILDISCKCFNCTDEYFGANMTVVDDFNTKLDKYSDFHEIKIYSEKMGSEHDWHASIFVEINRHRIGKVAIPRHRTLFRLDMPVYVVTHDDTLIVSFKNEVRGVYVEVNLTNLLRFHYVDEAAEILHKASSHFDDLSEFRDVAEGLEHPVVIDVGQNMLPDKVMVRVFPADSAGLHNTCKEHRKGRT